MKPMPRNSDTPIQEDRNAVRMFSILPPEDQDEAYCARHERAMEPIPLVARLDGEIYTTSEGFTGYSCYKCLAEATLRAGDLAPKEVMQAQFAEVFQMWKKGQAPAEWFRVVDPGTSEANELAEEIRAHSYDEVHEIIDNEGKFGAE